jgi:phage terminase large subunit
LARFCRSNLVLETPAVFEPLLAPARYKGAHGGGGFGQVALLRRACGSKRTFPSKLRLSFALRETLKSLEFSVKKLLEAKIETHNAGAYFDVQDRRILSRRKGGVTIFEGMQNHTADSIKSLGGLSTARGSRKRSGIGQEPDAAAPDDSQAGSQLWFDWNPKSRPTRSTSCSGAARAAA